MSKPKFYACEICGHAHPWDWNGDCRDNANRFSDDDLDQKYGPDGYDLATMSDRVLADSDEGQDRESYSDDQDRESYTS